MKVVTLALLKLAPRQGDNAAMAVIELVTEPVSPKKAAVKEAEAAVKVAEAKAEEAVEAPVEETATEEVAAGKYHRYSCALASELKDLGIRKSPRSFLFLSLSARGLRVCSNLYNVLYAITNRPCL